MNDRRFAALNRQSLLFGSLTLLEICGNIRMAANGSADAWPDADMKAAIALLRERLATWEDHKHGKRFDDAVKALVEATIAEVEGGVAG